MAAQQEREAELATIDAHALAQYITTLLPPARGGDAIAGAIDPAQPAVADGAAGTGALAVGLAREFGASVTVYAAERSRGMVDFMCRRAACPPARG